MTADVIEVPADTWAPVPMRWALVRAGDVIVSRDGAPWMVTASEPGHPWYVRAVRYPEQQFATDVQPDETVSVLIPLVEREAVLTLREAGMGPRLIDRAS